MIVEASKPTATTTQQPYRPPGSTGSLSNFLAREENVQVGKVNSNNNNSKPTTTATKYAPPGKTKLEYCSKTIKIAKIKNNINNNNNNNNNRQ